MSRTVLRYAALTLGALAMVGPFVLPRGATGMTDASTTRSPSTPRTRSCGSQTASGDAPMAQVPVGWNIVPSDDRTQ